MYIPRIQLRAKRKNLLSLFKAVVLKKIMILCLSINTLTIFSSILIAGEISTFEKDATKDEISADTHQSSVDKRKNSVSSNDVECFFCLGNLFLDIMEDLIAAIFFEMGKKTELRMKHRAWGEPLLPFAKFDINYQNIKPDITSFNSAIELGYGFYGVDLRKSMLIEKNPIDDLTIDQAYFLLRFSRSPRMEVDLGFGQLRLRGSRDHSGFSFTMPVKIQPQPYWGLQFLPAWSRVNGNSMSDYTLLIPFTKKQFSVQMGYRWINSPNYSLHGPYLGSAIHF